MVGPGRAGRKIVLSGDTAPCQAVEVLAHGADVLVHESTFLSDERARARETGHSTAAQAAELARDAGVRLLALTHLSTRYFPRDIRDEARAIFPETVVPRDFDAIEVPFPERGAPALVKPDREPAPRDPPRHVLRGCVGGRPDASGTYRADVAGLGGLHPLLAASTQLARHRRALLRRRRDDLVVLVVDPERLDDLREELAPSTGETFPHLYSECRSRPSSRSCRWRGRSRGRSADALTKVNGAGERNVSVPAVVVTLHLSPAREWSAAGGRARAGVALTAAPAGTTLRSALGSWPGRGGRKSG